MIGWEILSLLIWILVVGVVIYGMMILLMKIFEKQQDKAIKILKERFARREINEIEYDDKKRVLLKK